MVLYQIASVWLLVSNSIVIKGKTLGEAMDKCLEMVDFQWDEGAEEFRAPKTLGIAAPLDVEGLNMVTGWLADDANTSWAGCWSGFLFMGALPEGLPVVEDMVLDLYGGSFKFAVCKDPKILNKVSRTHDVLNAKLGIPKLMPVEPLKCEECGKTGQGQLVPVDLGFRHKPLCCAECIRVMDENWEDQYGPGGCFVGYPDPERMHN